MIAGFALGVRGGTLEISSVGEIFREVVKEVANSDMSDDDLTAGMLGKPGKYTEAIKENIEFNMDINEKSVSKAQQALMGQAWALRTGQIELDDISPKYRRSVKKIAFSKMANKELKDFAKTKLDGLPIKGKKEKKEDVSEGKIPTIIPQLDPDSKKKKKGKKNLENLKDYRDWIKGNKK